MFSGIVAELGQVVNLRRGREALTLAVRGGRVGGGAEIGASIAVNGVCLTVHDLKDDVFVADVMAETLKSTTLDSLQVGDAVNLEPALRVGDPIGGHMVTGHVDGVGTVRRRQEGDNSFLLEIGMPPGFHRYLVAKGSVAVDGVSLTVVRYTEISFQVSIIPHTAAQTTLGRRRPGDRINLEADLFGKYVAKLWDEAGPGRGARS